MYLQSLSIYASILSTTDSNDCKPKDPVSCLKKWPIALQPFWDK